MVTHNERSADCFVYVFKEGALSALGHDLEFRVTRFEIERSADGYLRAWFDAGALQVVTALRDGHAVDALKATDKTEIASLVRRTVLEVDRYPRIEFRSNGPVAEDVSGSIMGQVTLHGVTQAVEVSVDRLERFEATIHQPDFGIRPYRALLGTLRIKPNVIVKGRIKR